MYMHMNTCTHRYMHRCVHMHTCAHTPMHIHRCTCIHIHAQAQARTCACMYTPIHMHRRVHAHTCATHAQACTNTHVATCVRIHVHTRHSCMHAHTCTNRYAHLCTCTNTYTWMHVHTHAQTGTHTHTCTNVYTCIYAHTHTYTRAHTRSTTCSWKHPDKTRAPPSFALPTHMWKWKKPISRHMRQLHPSQGSGRRKVEPWNCPWAVYPKRRLGGCEQSRNEPCEPMAWESRQKQRRATSKTKGVVRQNYGRASFSTRKSAIRARPLFQ